MRNPLVVIPHLMRNPLVASIWIPASAGMTSNLKKRLAKKAMPEKGVRGAVEKPLDF